LASLSQTYDPSGLTAWRAMVELVVYDAIERKAYWLYFQKYFDEDKTREPKAKATTVTVRIPIGNVISETTIDYMRARKAKFMARFAKVNHHD
jgi:hypothetical protein